MSLKLTERIIGRRGPGVVNDEQHALLVRHHAQRRHIGLTVACVGEVPNRIGAPGGGRGFLGRDRWFSAAAASSSPELRF